jgi:hypothetical protein
MFFSLPKGRERKTANSINQKSSVENHRYVDDKKSSVEKSSVCCYRFILKKHCIKRFSNILLFYEIIFCLK